jgi:hypothetical protein
MSTGIKRLKRKVFRWKKDPIGSFIILYNIIIERYKK